jgi:DNA repair protein RadA
MGSFDRLSKSRRTKNQLETEKPAENRQYTSSSPSPEPVITAAVAVVPNNLDLRVENRSLISATAVAVAEIPEVYEPTEAHLGFTAEPSDAALFDDAFDQDLDDAFASLVSQDASPETQSVSGEMVAGDQSSVEELFADIAANHARPVKNFIFELKRGTATRDWVEVCIPAMHGITRAAEGMGLTLAAQRMVEFKAALSLGQSSKDRVLRGEVRDVLLQRYEDLTEVMPKAFVVAEEEERLREGIIINSLLRQIPGVGRLTVGKVYRAGLTSIDTLQMARADELAVATGIPSRLSERICEKFRTYSARLENNHDDPCDLGQRARLTSMVAELRSLHENFQRASKNAWLNPALASEKRDYRQQRQSCFLWINVLLAEEGEVELVNQLKKLSFDRRIRRLEEYLAHPPAAM